MRIAHLSDPHFAGPDLINPQLTNWHWLKNSPFSISDFFNKRLVGSINFWLTRRKKHSPLLFRSLCNDLHQNQIDQIVITGDLTNISLPSEFQFAQETIKFLDFPFSAVTLIPGNHDVYVKKAKGLFEQYFASYLPLLSNNLDGKERIEEPSLLGKRNSSSVESPFPFVKIVEDVVFIVTSTAEPSLPFFAIGALGEKQRWALKQILLAHVGKFRVLLIHHPPVAYRHDFLRGLRDKKELQALLLETGCELILHGHEHRDLVASLQGAQGPIPIIGVGSCTYADPRLDRRARYNIYTISESHLIKMECRVHDPMQNQFIQYSVSSFS